MHLLRQEFVNIHTVDPEQPHYLELLENQGHGISEVPTMDILRDFISDTPNPTIIYKAGSGEIVLTNTSALMVSERPDLIGRIFDEEFPVIGTDPEGNPMVQINEYCSSVSSTEFKWDGEEFIRSEMIKKADSPTEQNLEVWKKMIAVMLHRFRSPLTGVSGYLEMLREHASDKKIGQHVDKVSKGIDQVFNIMDELESLHHSPTGSTHSSATTASLGALVDIAALDLPNQARKRIRMAETDITLPLKCANSSLKLILRELLENAWENDPNGQSEILVSRISEQVIRVQSAGEPIPDDIARNLFYPFITTKAANLGIGLSIALMHARHHNGNIFLTENSTEKGIAFDIYLKN